MRRLQCVVVVALLAVFGVDVSHVGAEPTKDFGPEELDAYPPQWCRTPDGKAFAVTFDREQKEARLYSVVERPDGRRRLTAVSHFSVPPVDPAVELLAIVLQAGRRLVLYAVRGFDASPSAIALMVFDQGRAPLTLRRDRFVGPADPNPALPTGPDLPWLNEVVDVTDAAIVISTLEDTRVRIDLTTGSTTMIPDVGGPYPEIWFKGACTGGLVTVDPGPPVCPDTLRPPSAPAGIPELNLCHYDFAIVVSDTWQSGDDRAGQRTITLAMFGQAYRLRLEARPEALGDRPMDIAYSLTSPNKWTIADTDKKSAMLLSGLVEDEPKATVAGVSDSTGIVSLEIVTPKGNMYVVRRSLLFKGEADDGSLLAYKKSDIGIDPPKE